MRFQGLAYRAHDPRWSFKPLSGSGAAIHGGRFNPKGKPALYVALDPMTAIKEAAQGFARKFEPCVLCAYEIDCEDVVDLRGPDQRRAAGVAEEDMASPWFAAGAREPASWRLARRLIEGGAAGMLAPSFVRGATADDVNLILWNWSGRMPHKVTVYDRSGRLPKNQLSWDRGAPAPEYGGHGYAENKRWDPAVSEARGGRASDARAPRRPVLGEKR